MERNSMNKARKKTSSAGIPILLGFIAILIVLIVVMAIFVVNRKPQEEPGAQKEQDSAVSAVEIADEYPENYQIQFKQEWMINKDFRGYLTLEGTALSTNVVQGTDNTFYRDHGFDGGTDSRIAFLDYRANIESPSSQLLIYLPHSNNHVKYGELVKFKDLEYYKEHPVISFNSLYRNAQYKVFSVALFPSGYDGIPFQTCMETSDKTQLVTLVQKAMEHSILEIPVDVRDTDELLTVMSEDMSLMDENGKYARIVVFARKIRDGESEVVDTQNAAIKSNKYMPQGWYDQILRSQYVSVVNEQIRQEAAKWFSNFELSKIADADLERMMNARMAEYQKYLTEAEMLLPAEEKAHLYEKRINEAENPVLTLEVQNVTARVGDEFLLEVRRTPQDPKATYTWTTSNDSVISVMGQGDVAKLTAHKKGTATVTVTSGKTTASCKVEVKEKDHFVLNPSSITIFADDSYNIRASGDVQYASSSNNGVAKVSVNQNTVNVYGVAPGNATITVTSKDGYSATCQVTVKKYQLTFDKTSLDMKIGNRRNIYVSTGAAANWFVDNPSVVKMSVVQNGKAVLVEAIGAGNATVTATARNGAQVSCKITVNGNGVAFSTTQMDMHKGEFRTMQVTRGNVVRWEISDKSVAQVCIFGNGTSIEVEALAYGTATIKAYGSDGSVATLTVNVSAPRDSLTITPYSMTLTKGDMRNITVTSGSASNWVSSNPSVAEVYVLGDGTMAQVEGRNPGTATITVYDQYGGWVNCNVTVEAQVSKLTVGPTTIRMDEGDWEDVRVLSGVVVDWSTTNADVVGIYTVGGELNNIRIKANGPGTAQVVAHGADGSTASCTVTVNAPAKQVLALDRTSMSINVGESGILSVADGYTAEWISSNSAVAEVFMLGHGIKAEVEGHAPGTAIITAYWPDGSTASCTVTVVAPSVPAAVEDPVRLNATSIVVEAGDWGEIHVTSGRCVNWNTSNQNIVRLYDVGDPNLIRIKGESAGTAEVIAYGSDGTTTVCKVTVKPYEAPVSIAQDTGTVMAYVPEPEYSEQEANDNGDSNAAESFDNG